MPTKKKQAHVYVDKRTDAMYALFTYTDRFGKRKYVYRRARNATHAKDLYKAMEAEYKERGAEAFEGARMTFRELAEYAKKHYVKEAMTVGGIKVSGMKSYMDARQKLDVMCGYFGHRKVRDITAEDIAAYRDERLKTPTRRKLYDSKGKATPKPRSIASVQRELSLLRRVLNIARRKRWIAFNPFDEGGFISNAAEDKRTRVISRDEEAALLLACDAKSEKLDRQYLTHLRPFIICGIDTGMRSGEMFKLQWRDVNLDARTIRVVASNTKTEQARTVPVTARLHAELLNLWEASAESPDASVFGLTRIKRGWRSLCKLAGVYDATPHCLRHTCATRLIESGMPIAQVSRILGHSDVRTTFRYTHTTAETVDRAAAALDAYHAGDEESTVH
jgi:integrase